MRRRAQRLLIVVTALGCFLGLTLPADSAAASPAHAVVLTRAQLEAKIARDSALPQGVTPGPAAQAVAVQRAVLTVKVEREEAAEKRLAERRAAAEAKRAAEERAAAVRAAPVQPSAPATAPPPAVSGDLAQRALDIALSAAGCNYVYGADGPCSSGFDCSGLVMWAYAAAGAPYFGRDTWDMLDSGKLTQISQSQLQPGDLVFMYGGNHVELYAGPGDQTFGAHHTGTQVSYATWSDVYGFYRVNG
jgi:peptidoglycan DL-endopeptidase CwlO